MFRKSAVPFAAPSSFWTGLENRGGRRHPFRRDVPVTSAFLGGTCLSGPINTDRRPIALHRARQACPSDLSEGPACQVRSTPIDDPSPFIGHDKRAPPTFRRDLLVRSDQHRSTTRRPSSGTTSVPLRPFGGTCLSGPHINVRLSTRLQWARQACPSAVQRMPWQASRQCPRAPRRCFRGFGRAQCFQNLQSLVGLKVQAIISACGLLISRASHSCICCGQGPVH